MGFDSAWKSAALQGVCYKKAHLVVFMQLKTAGGNQQALPK